MASKSHIENAMSDNKRLEGLLNDVIERLNALSTRVERMEAALHDCSQRIRQLEETVEELPAEM
jgi:hypothetical protein